MIIFLPANFVTRHLTARCCYQFVISRLRWHQCAKFSFYLINYSWAD